jgi:hypothetical protein
MGSGWSWGVSDHDHDHDHDYVDVYVRRELKAGRGRRAKRAVDTGPQRNHTAFLP